MSHRTVPIARLAAAALAVALVAACGDSSQPPVEVVATGTDTRPVTAGAAVYTTGSYMCVVCHGRNGEGGPMGPSLDGLEADWNEQDLASFLIDPLAWLPKSARLNEIHSRYPQGMPKPNGLSQADAALLARWLLAGRPQ